MMGQIPSKSFYQFLRGHKSLDLGYLNNLWSDRFDVFYCCLLSIYCRKKFSVLKIQKHSNISK